MYTNVYVCVYTYTHTHTHIYIYIYVYVCRIISVPIKLIADQTHERSKGLNVKANPSCFWPGAWHTCPESNPIFSKQWEQMDPTSASPWHPLRLWKPQIWGPEDVIHCRKPPLCLELWHLPPALVEPWRPACECPCAWAIAVHSTWLKCRSLWPWKRSKMLLERRWVVIYQHILIILLGMSWCHVRFGWTRLEVWWIASWLEPRLNETRYDRPTV